MAEVLPFPTASDVPKPPPDSLAIELIAGSVGGASQVLVGQPLNTLKTVRWVVQ